MVPYADTMDPRVAMIVEQLWQPVPGGSGRYIVELARCLSAEGVKARGVAACHSTRALATRACNLSIPVTHSALPRRALYAAWDHLDRPPVDDLAAGANLVHATTWAIPPTRLPLVVTVHDTAFLRDPSHFTRHGAAYFTRALARTRDRAEMIVVPSEATAVDCVDAGIPIERIRVIPHGVTHIATDPEQTQLFKERNSLSRPYILWVGTREPRKNLSALLRAFGILIGVGCAEDLVLVGPAGWGDDSREMRLLAGLPRDRVHVLGRLTNADLACAYAGARVFCFPSIWEGFGLPVLEAMDQGVPVVTSSGTSMAEVTGNSGVLVDPTSPEEIAEGLLAAGGPEHDELGRRARTRAASFTWEASAASHAQVYREMLG